MRFFWPFLAVVFIFMKDLASSQFGESDSSEESNYRDVELYEHKDFKGEKLTLPAGFKGCVNFFRNNLSNFNDYFSSTKLNGNCLDVYSGVGCSGNQVKLTHGSDRLKNFEDFQWRRRISSLKLCNTILPQVYRQPWGSKGDLCLGACESQGRNYFSCQLSNGSIDFCFPRPGMDYFGNDCDSNCSRAFANTEKYSPLPVLYEHDEYVGKFLELKSDEKNRCFNFHYKNELLRDFNKFVSSVDVKQHCLYLYEHIGCTGERLELSGRVGIDCQASLQKCKFNDETSSVSLCEASFPPNHTNPIGSRGSNCKNSCETRGKPYFWCDVESGDWDYCSPRPGLDFLGNECGNNNCSDMEYSSSPVLFEHDKYVGEFVELDAEDKNRCFNFRYTNESVTNFDNFVSSVDVKQHCLYLYEHIGCTGERLELSGRVGVDCQASLQKCKFNDVTSSVSLCEASFPPNHTNPIGSRGSNCKNSCETRGKPYFWCDVESGDWDYCSLRPGLDFLGNECGDNCSGTAEKFPQLAVLYEEKKHTGESYTLSSNEEKPCLNLRSKSDSNSLPTKTIRSIKLKGSCVQFYKNRGCTGVIAELISSEDNATCLFEDLNRCDKSIAAASVKFCNANHHPLRVNRTGSRGGACSTSCDIRGRDFYWCYVEGTSVWEYCYPWLGADSFGEECEGNCPDYGFNTRRQRAILYVQTGFEGKRHVVESARNPQCFNLGYDDELSLNFYQMIHSIDLNSSDPMTCLLIYDSVGCTGNFLTISNWDNKNCHTNLGDCGWGNKVASVSFCNVRLPSKISEPKGLNGNGCVDACETRGKTFFWCHLQNGSWDFCSPRADQNYLGGFCDGNCSNAVMVIPHQKASLYLKKWFQDKHLKITSASKRKCFNLGFDAKLSVNFNNDISSIAMDKDTCLRLYDSIGCFGKFLELAHAGNVTCHGDLAECDWDQKVSSVSFCDTHFFPVYDNPKGIHGGSCISRCDAEGRTNTYFWCTLENSDWDFCYPRPEVNFFGEDWVPGNSAYNYDNIERAILYDQKNFEGNQVTITSGDNKRCFNLGQDESTASFNKNLASIDLNGSCLQLYESIGCCGDFLEVYLEDGDDCQYDLSGCAWSERVSSISFCNTYFPPKYAQPKTLQGEDCIDDCETRGKSYFSCYLKNGTLDFCLPRPGQDVFGNDCDQNCADPESIKLLAEEAKGGARMIALNKFLITAFLLSVTLMSYEVMIQF